jgi:hypothetical protein
MSDGAKSNVLCLDIIAWHTWLTTACGSCKVDLECKYVHLELGIRSEEAFWTMDYIFCISLCNAIALCEAVHRHIFDCGVGRTVKASFGKCTRTSTVAGGSNTLGLITTSSGDIATSVPIVGL